MRGGSVVKKENSMSPDLQEVLDVCRGAFYSAAGFSLLINFLMLLPAIYMLQLYDRVIPSGSESTLVMLTLIVVFLFITLGRLSGCVPSSWYE